MKVHADEAAPTARAMADDYHRFVLDAQPALRRVFVARYGTEIGLDVASEALAYAWENWSKVSAMDRPIGYLVRVGQSRARRLIRWSRTISLPVEAAPPADAGLGLHDALARMRPSQRSAVVLVHSFGYSYREAAELMGVPESSVRNHVHRGLRSLRRILKEQNG